MVSHRLSDASGLKEPEQVRDSQEKVVQSLQQYTTANYSTMPSKFGELLLRIPELQRVCQVGSLFVLFISQTVCLWFGFVKLKKLNTTLCMVYREPLIVIRATLRGLRKGLCIRLWEVKGAILMFKLLTY